MAHLLGNKLCIESLQKDVGDLQAIIADIFSRTGAVAFPSWKYPDKLSCDLDINGLLDRYSFTDDEEDCQVSHVILLELLIDRLVLVIQSFSKYMDQMLMSGQGNSQQSSISIGLMVKKYWNKTIQLHSVIKRLKSDNSSKSRRMVDMQDMMDSVQTNIEHTTIQDDLPDWMTPPKSSLSAVSVSNDYNCKSSQTYETCFIPCEACDGTQYCLREAAKAISEVCTTQALPSSLKKMNQMHKDNWMSIQDIRTWVQEQNKDLLQLSNRMNHLSETITGLEKDLDTSNQTCKKLTSDFKNTKAELAQQKENITVTRKQYEKKLKDTRDKSNETIVSLERKNDELLKTKENLEVRVADLKCQLDQQTASLKNLERAQNKLLDDLQANKTTEQEMKRSQKYVEILEKEVKEIHNQLDEANRNVARAAAKNSSSQKQIENLKTKQAELFDQIENLEGENETLKCEIADVETEKESLATTLQNATADLGNIETDRAEFKARIEDLSAEKTELTKRIHHLEDKLVNLELQVQKAKEQERLLIEYPDLNGPINTDFEGTGDVARDMENQMHANSVRISILQEENEQLRHSVKKIRQTAPSQARPVQPISTDNVPPLQLWRN